MSRSSRVVPRTIEPGTAGPASEKEPALQPNPGRLWPKLLLLLATLVIMLPVMEAAVRWLAPQQPSWLSIYRRHPELPTYAYQTNAYTTVDTGESRWTIRTDNMGFRVAQRPIEDDALPVVLWLGDSFTFGYGVDYEDSFVGQLALDPQRRFRHLNAAVGGYGPIQYRQTLEYLLGSGLKPHVVVVATFLGNDFLDCIESKDIPVRDGILGNEGGLKSFLKRRLHLYRLSTNALHRVPPIFGQKYTPGGEQVSVRAWSGGRMSEAALVYRREFARIAELCRQRQVELAVLIIPMVGAAVEGPAETPDHATDQTLPFKAATAVFRDLNIPYLDLAPALSAYPLREIYFQHDGHFSPGGHRVVADLTRREWSHLFPP